MTVVGGAGDTCSNGIKNPATDFRGVHMEHFATIHIEKLPEGVYLATSDDVPGLVAQGRTIAETLAIARAVAKTLLEAHSGGNSLVALRRR